MGLFTGNQCFDLSAHSPAVGSNELNRMQTDLEQKDMAVAGFLGQVSCWKQDL